MWADRPTLGSHPLLRHLPLQHIEQVRINVCLKSFSAKPWVPTASSTRAASDRAMLLDTAYPKPIKLGTQIFAQRLIWSSWAPFRFLELLFGLVPPLGPLSLVPPLAFWVAFWVNCRPSPYAYLNYDPLTNAL